MKNDKSTVCAGNKSPRRFKNDVIFIALILAAVSLLGLSFYLFRPEGDVVEITLDGELYGSYPLSEDTVLDIESERGHNRLVISGGKAHVEEASCPDGICAAHRPISRTGESIVCLPNKVVITVVGKPRGDAPDIVV